MFVETWQNVKIVLKVIFLWLSLIPILVAVLPFIAIAFIVRQTEDWIYQILYNSIHFSAEDHVWLYHTSENHAIINGLVVIETKICIETVRDIIDKRLVRAADDEIGKNLRYPRATRYIHEGWLNFHWMKEEKFRLEQHVFEYDTRSHHSLKEVQTIASQISSRPLVTKENLSPWEFILFHFKEEGGTERTAILFRCSHAVSDGVSLVHFIVNGLSDRDQGRAEKKMTAPDKSTPTAFQKWYLRVKAVSMLPYNAATQSPMPVSHDTILNVKKNCGTKHFACTKPIPMGLITAVKNKLNVKVNDVMIGCLATCLHKYHCKVKGSVPSGSLNALVPMNARLGIEEAEGFRNRIGGGLLQLDITSDNTVENILKTHEKMSTLKNSLSALTGHFIACMLRHCFPFFVQNVILDTIMADVTMALSNVHGPDFPLYLSGYKIHSMMFWPPIRRNVNAATSIISYHGNIRMAIACDESATDKPDEIFADLESVLKDIIVATGITDKKAVAK